MRSSEPPLCNVHQRAANNNQSQLIQAGPPALKATRPNTPGGFYARRFTLEEITDLLGLALKNDLSDEVSAVRVAVRRVMDQFESELSPAEYAGLARIIIAGTDAIARLMRAQKELADQHNAQFTQALIAALDEMAQEEQHDH